MASPEPSAHGAEKLADDDDTPQSPSLTLTLLGLSLTLSPTQFLILVAAIYYLTPIAGSAFSTPSSPPESANIFSFSHKRNPVNVFFVKYGWLWTTLVFLIHISRLRSSKLKALLRYAAATAWWILVAKWFFGPPLMDWLFLATGGKCQLVDADPMRAKEEVGTAQMMSLVDRFCLATGGKCQLFDAAPMCAKEEVGTAQMVFTSAACKVVGGKWSGGHDLSGHVFLLTHASLFLWSEFLPIWIRSGAAGWESAGVLTLLALWWWMLLMTGLYFHTWPEKITGWVGAIVEWAGLYLWALRLRPTARRFFGVPGV
ncbi:hypothetical protein C7212DRAFT_366219 [Tuber magnatum]|uniref:FIT family protein scs3 n=1 Tax=Tuber magnatum TaxID=42249 RepID=A0A317SIR8_9PEZI|nr:hypothetical protein C7212DRAFT_366219 [Tuber magnatum]